jgi:hypothetical protein
LNDYFQRWDYDRRLIAFTPFSLRWVAISFRPSFMPKSASNARHRAVVAHRKSFRKKTFSAHSADIRGPGLTIDGRQSVTSPSR